VAIQTPIGFERGRVVIRGDSGYWLVGSVVAIFLLFDVSAFAQGAVAFGIRALPWSLFVIWLLYVVLIRPCVILTPGMIDIVNIFRRYAVRWAAIAHTGTRYQLVIELGDGRRITSQGASRPTPRRSRTARTGDAMRVGYGRRGVADPPPHKIIESVMSSWDSGVASDRPDYVASWDWPAVVPLLVLAVLCVLDVVVGPLVH
jgi:hypothetical protein